MSLVDFPKRPVSLAALKQEKNPQFFLFNDFQIQILAEGAHWRDFS
jgi:hypothetical protein